MRLVGRFRCFLDKGCDFLWMRQKDGVVSGELDCFRLGSATHESLELGIDHAILLRDYRVTGFLRPCRYGGLGSEDLLRDRPDIHASVNADRFRALAKLD